MVHVNDTHSHLFPFTTADDPRVRGGFARLATVLREVRGGGDPVLLLHGGDAVSGSGTDYLWNSQPDYQRIPTYGWRGIDVVDAMNLLGFDAAVIGNHELDCGRRWLQMRMEQARYPVLSANVMRRNLPDIDGSTGTPLAKPYVVVTKGNVRVGIIGLTTTEYIMSTQVQVKDPLPILRELVPEVSKQCDVLVVLSHAGYDKDLEMARDVPGIDLIVGGHTHTLVPVPVVVGSTLVVQDGQFAEQVGILELTITDGAIASHRYQLRRLDPSVAEDPAADAALRRFLAIGSVGDRKLVAVKYQRSDLGSLATSAMLAATGADAAMIASDSLSGALGPGSPTVQEFFNVFWPYHSRSLMPEKDLDERQMISTLAAQGGSVPAALRAVVRASDGLRTLVSRQRPGRRVDGLARGQREPGGRARLRAGGPAGTAVVRVGSGVRAVALRGHADRPGHAHRPARARHRRETARGEGDRALRSGAEPARYATEQLMSRLVERGIARTLVSMAVPMLAGTFALNAYNLADTWYVARLGTEPLAAMSFTFPVVMFLGFFVRGIGTGAMTVVAHSLGAHRKEDAATVATHGSLLCVVAGAVLAVAGWFSIRPVFTRLGASGEILLMAEQYMRIWYVGMVFRALQVTFNDVVIGTGHTKASSSLMVLGTVLNFVLDPVMIFGLLGFPKMGIRGAALATVISEGIVMVSGFVLL